MFSDGPHSGLLSIATPYWKLNRISSVMVSVFASSAVDRGLELRFCQTTTIKEKEQRLIDMHMSIRGLLFQ